MKGRGCGWQTGDGRPVGATHGSPLRRLVVAPVTRLLPLLSLLVLASCASAGGAEGARDAEYTPSRSWHGEASPLLLKELREVHARSGIGGDLAVSVYSLRHGRFEARQNDTVPFVPASTAKLVITAAAIEAFPVDAAPYTTLEVAGTLRGRTLHGTLRAVGGGDPNVSKRFYPDALAPLRVWADSLRALGIDTVRGSVVALDTFFTGPHRPAAWPERHFNAWYGAEVSALSYNDNAYEITVGPGERPGVPAAFALDPDVGHVRVVNQARTVQGARHGVTLTLRDDVSDVILTGTVGAGAAPRTWVFPVRNPPEYFRRALLAALDSSGIRFIAEDGAATAPLLREYRFTTAPMISLIDEVNQRSQNLHAERLVRHLGKRIKGEGTAKAGITAAMDFVARQGVDPRAFELHDGSGLSDRNRLQAGALTGLLARMARHPDGGDYIASLAQPGLDGATGARLRGFTGSGMARYKTGSLNGVSGLSGYVFALDGDTLAATLLLNNFAGPSAPAADLLDTLLMRTALWYNKERPAAARAHTLLNRPDVPRGYAERLRHFSKELEGTPYFLGPTGEGRHADVDPLPIVDMERMDCVTYMEAVLGLARVRRAADLVPAIIPFRYRGDTVSYENRNHYFVGEWLANNPDDFRVLELPGDTVFRKTLHRRQLLAGKGVTGPDLTAEIRQLPYEEALRLARNWTLGDRFLGIAFLTDREGLDATHTGFVDARGGVPMLRHASQLRGRVASESLADYLESRRGRCSGIVLFEFLPPVSERERNLSR